MPILDRADLALYRSADQLAALAAMVRGSALVVGFTQHNCPFTFCPDPGPVAGRLATAATAQVVAAVVPPVALFRSLWCTFYSTLARANSTDHLKLFGDDLEYVGRQLSPTIDPDLWAERVA